MALTNKQKATLAIYRKTADMAEQEYRAMLFQLTGCRSSTDRRFTDRDFAEVMAAMELRVAEKWGRGEIDHLPTGVGNLNYWRSQLPEAGQINSRKLRLIYGLHADLAKVSLVKTDAASRATYLVAMAKQALGTTPIAQDRAAGIKQLTDLTDTEANLLISALRARLAQEIRPCQPAS